MFHTYGTFVQLQLCGCVSFLVVVGYIPQNENTILQKNLIGLLFYDPIADVCIYKTKHSFTLYLSILYIFLVEDPQFPGGRQTALKLPLALASTTKSSTRVNLLS